MRILVTGSHGLLGAALVSFLEAAGHEPVRLLRTTVASENGVTWEPTVGKIDQAALEDLDAVVHLAGENLAARRWSQEQKDQIRESRVGGTRLLCQTLAKLNRPPKVLLSASAVGFYGSRGEKILTEETPRGTGFLAEVCEQWEAATRSATRAGVRVALLRFAMVLAPGGGALAKMLPIFRRGLGGRLGAGTQYWSWISLTDAVHAIMHLLGNDKLAGPVNFSAPHPVTNLEFTTALGEAIGRSTPLPVPAFALRLSVGEMADEALLASARVLPTRLQATGFSFQHPELGATLAQLVSGTA